MLVLPLICMGLALTVGAGGCSGNVTDNDITDVGVTRVKQLVDTAPKSGLVLIDARSAQDYSKGHLPTARSMPLDTVSVKPRAKDPALEKAEVIVVYGEDPGSALARGVTKRLIEAGYDEVYYFRGGVLEWNRNGFPIVK